MNVAIIGSRGFTGQTLLRILLNHPDVAKIYPVSSSKAGLDIHSLDPGISKYSGLGKLADVDGRYLSLDRLRSQFHPDCIFTAVPHLESAELVAEFSPNAVVIDLSADFRIPNQELFKAAYGQPSPRPELLPLAVYGLSEWKREELRRANIIANPGCYPTATLLPLLPLLTAGLKPESDIVVNAISGISGAGKKLEERYLFSSRSENVSAYSPGRSHRHWQEMHWHLADISQNAKIELYFTPHLVPLHRGMLVTTSLVLKNAPSDMDIQAIFAENYADSPFLRQSPNIPETAQVRGTNCCDYYWYKEGKRLFLISAIDNLYKGASGQAVQNMNIRFGIDERQGLGFHADV